jgi:hypothetical protein
LSNQGPKGPVVLSNSESAIVAEGRSGGAGVSSASERERTQPEIKVPKFKLSEEKRLQPYTIGRLAQKQPPFKECVIAHLSRLMALKMDGTKLGTDILDSERIMVERCPARAEASS